MSTMQRHLEHLIEDIQESAANRDTNANFVVPRPVDIPEHFDHLPFEPTRKAHEWFGLSMDMFPSADKWNERQLLELCVILRQLFEHYNMQVELSNCLPYDIVYTFLLKAMETYTTCRPGSGNVDVISFCAYDSENCPFGDYCAAEDEYSCDTWVLGHHWDGYLDWEERRKNTDS